MDQAPMNAMARVGVRYRGCSRANPCRKTPSAAIAWNTRGVTRITRFRNPKVDTAMPALTNRLPRGPSTRAITSAAGAVLAASPATPSTRRYARFASRYTATDAHYTRDERPRQVALGRDQLLRDEVGLLPAAVGEEDGHERGAQGEHDADRPIGGSEADGGRGMG